MPAFTFFHEFEKYLGEKKIDLANDSFRWIISNVAPNVANNTVKADITEIAAGNGYSTGGVAASGVTWAETAAGSGIWQWSCSTAVLTASGGSFATGQYAILYDDTPTSPADPLIGFLAYPAPFVITDTNALTIEVGSGGVFRSRVY